MTRKKIMSVIAAAAVMLGCLCVSAGAESLNAAAAGAVLLWELVGKYASPNE